MEKFCKIFDFDEAQVLLDINYEPEEDVYKLRYTTYVDGIQAEIKTSFKDEEKAINALESKTTEDMEGF